MKEKQQKYSGLKKPKQKTDKKHMNNLLRQLNCALFGGYIQNGC